jgi:O-antigen/teichoic acid export membrane protein
MANPTRGRRIALAFSTGLVAKVAAILPQVVAVPVVIGSVGVAEFGKYATVSSALAWVALTGLGLGPGLTQRLAVANARQAPDEETTLFASAVAGITSAVVASAVVLAIVLVVLASSIHLQGDDVLTAVVLAVAVLAQLELSPIDAALIGYQELHWVNVMAAVSSVATVIAVATVATFAPSVWAFAAALGWTPVAFKLLNGALLFSRRPYLVPSLRRMNPRTAISLLGTGLLFLGVQAGPLLGQQGAVVLSASIVGAGAAATAAVLLRLLLLAFAPIVVGTQALWPAVIDAREGMDVRWIKMAMRRALAMSCIYALGIVGALLLYGTQFINLWSAGGLSIAPTVVALFGVALVVNVWTHVHAIVLMGLGRVAVVAAILMAESLVALGLMVILLPLIGPAAPWLALACASGGLGAWLLPLVVARALRSSVTSADGGSARVHVEILT